MSQKIIIHKENYLKNLQFDIPAGFVVFLVAVPLCLGISLASNAPFFSGIIAGILGGILVPLISQSQLSVSGPAAGLTTIVLVSIAEIGSFNGFLVALVIAGILQIMLGLFRVGFVAYYIPSMVIKGMLAAIGLILILKQLPHAIGYDVEFFEDDKFFVNQDENTFTLLLHALFQFEIGALIISIVSLTVLILWEKSSLKNIHWIPAALFVVLLGLGINYLFGIYAPHLKLNDKHLVALPVINNFNDILLGFTFPDWSFLNNQKVWTTAFTVGIVASIETLLTLEALDKLDVYKRRSPLNRELIAQGVGNSVSGLIGGIPITSVIVRSSVGINSGGRTKMFVIFHGLFLLFAVVFLSQLMNQIPLACLAAILLMVGYKLVKPENIRAIRKKGNQQFYPFIVTILAILFTDLLIGVAIGICVGLYYVLRSNFQSAFTITKDGNSVLIRFHKDVSFLNKPLLTETLESIEEHTYLIIDGKNAKFMDNDILELFEEFEQESKFKNIEIEFKNFYKNVNNDDSLRKTALAK